MAQTVIGIFSSTGDAQSARQALLSRGFDDSNVDMSARRDSSDAGASRSDDEDDFGDKISNFFKDLFIDDENSANNYSVAASKGIVLTVHARDREEAEKAADILDDNGAVDIDDYAADYTRNVNGMGGIEPFENDDSTSGRESNSVPVIDEELQVGKREVEGGTKRVRTRIVERPVEETIRLREERVNIERNPVNRVATEADLSGFRDETIEVVEHREVPVVNKEARVVEEINITKEVDQREERISDTVRHTEVDIDDIETTNRARSADANFSNDSEDGYDNPDNDLRR